MEMENVARNYSPVFARATKGKMAAFQGAPIGLDLRMISRRTQRA